MSLYTLIRFLNTAKTKTSYLLPETSSFFPISSWTKSPFPSSNI